MPLRIHLVIAICDVIKYFKGVFKEEEKKKKAKAISTTCSLLFFERASLILFFFLSLFCPIRTFFYFSFLFGSKKKFYVFSEAVNNAFFLLQVLTFFSSSSLLGLLLLLLLPLVLWADCQRMRGTSKKKEKGLFLSTRQDIKWTRNRSERLIHFYFYALACFTFNDNIIHVELNHITIVSQKQEQN